MELVETKATEGLHAALLAVQAELPHLQRTKINPAFRSRYVPLEEVHDEVLPILNQHGLVWLTLPILGGLIVHEERLTEGQPCLHYQLVHAATGEMVEGTMPLMIDKQNPQGQGSAITYARRYALMAVLGLVADDDDDGNKGSGARRPTGKRETRKASKPATPAAQQAPPDRGGADRVNATTLQEIKDSYEASGITAEAFAEILVSAGAGGTPISELPQDNASWVLIALREHIDKAATDVPREPAA